MTDDELRLALLKMDVLLKRRQVVWEVPKAIAMMAFAAAVFGGFVIAGVNWVHPGPQQITATIHLDQPLAVQIIPGASK